MAYHPRICATPAELRAKAREYRERGLLELAKWADKQAAYVEKRDRRSKGQ